LPPAASGASSSSADAILPPGAAGSTPTERPLPIYSADAPASPTDNLLPQSSGAPVSEKQVPLPTQEQPRQSVKGGPVVIPTGDGKYVALRDPVKRVVTAGGGEMELRKLSEEEKASRRMR